MQSWFVYYKVPLVACADITLRARSVAAALSGWVAVSPRVLRKVDDAAVVTLMEVYEGVSDPQGLSTAMSEATVTAGMPRDLIEARRVERFMPAE